VRMVESMTTRRRKPGKLYNVKNYKKSKAHGNSPKRNKSPVPKRELVNGKLIKVRAKKDRPSPVKANAQTPPAPSPDALPGLPTDENVIDKEYHAAKMEWRKERKEMNERIANWMAIRANDQHFVRPFTTNPRFGATFVYTGDAIPTIERNYGSHEKDEKDEKE
ncbi:hypothetical protein PENTCL1PPCAC_18590, partial [Pristionchus entomophagus]